MRFYLFGYGLRKKVYSIALNIFKLIFLFGVSKVVHPDFFMILKSITVQTEHFQHFIKNNR
jgi:hypothetical protein